MKKVLVIGIAGGSASGKSSVAQAILNHFKNENRVYILKLDDYYLSYDELSFEEKLLINYDHPLAFDYALMLEHIKMLKNNKAINKPIYSFIDYQRINEYEIISNCEVVIVEGLYALENEKLRSLFDLKIFVDTDADVRLIRRIKRDVIARQRSLESIFKQYLNDVKPMHEQFVEPTRKYADIIIPHGQENQVAIDLVITKITSIINNNLI
jgi:uridine kinase